MKRPSKKKIIIIGAYIVIGGLLTSTSWLLTIIWFILYLCNNSIVHNIREYNNYPSAEGGAKRNYDRLILGGSWLLQNKSEFDASIDYIDTAYQRNLPMIFYCCKRLHSLVKHNGEIILYLERRLQIRPKHKYSLLDKSFILPAIRWKDGIRYNSIHIFLPLFCTPTYYICALISKILKTYSHKKENNFKEIPISKLELTNIHQETQEIIKEMQIFCKERELNFRLMIN